MSLLAVITTIAQVAAENPALFTYGPLGIITAWMMWRDEKRNIQIRESDERHFEQQRDVMHRIDGLTKALLIEKIDDVRATPYVRNFAREAVSKIDARAVEDAKAGNK